jgi:preprotein translocase subunit YajC
MTDSLTSPFLVAMAQPGQAQPSFLVQIFPFALMLIIFYLLVLMPMRRRQRKIQDFQSSLKVGDKVVTTGGIFGQVTEVREKEAAVQLQIADRVRIRVSRAAIAGYEGQDPVVQPESSSSSSS